MRKMPSLRILLFSLLFAFVMLGTSTVSSAQVGVGISVSFGPPPLPVYEQPLCPGDDYIWTPGYWAWDDDAGDYYWVPGTWVLSPEVGFLWTPPWWGWEGGAFLFHEGWWGPHIGFYGGINYGFGYFGEGFLGGRWEGGHFFYNRSVMNVNVVNIHNVYNQTVNVRNENHVSFNGGSGGIQARPRPEDEAADRERHLPPVAAQTQHFQAARNNPELRASTNHGKPPIAATDRPGEFRGGGAVPARQAGGEYHPPANRGGNRTGAPGRAENRPAPASEENRGAAPRGENAPSRTAVHPNELSPMERPGPPNTGNAKQDKKLQQQQEKLYGKQTQERQKLQQQQEKEHQQLAKQNANEARKQQVEQKHQQQTQQLQQRHVQQQQHLQQRTAPPPARPR